MFYEAMRCSGVRNRKAKVMYYAVYKFGPHWPAPGLRRSSRQLVARTRSGTPKLLTEVRRIQNFVESEDPSLEQIEADAIRTTSIQ